MEECTSCGHQVALHNARGCRLNGCPCSGFASATRRADPVERVIAQHEAAIVGLARVVKRQRRALAFCAVALAVQLVFDVALALGVIS